MKDYRSRQEIDLPLDEAAPALPLARWAGLAILLACEVMAIGIRFEGLDAARAGHRWWEVWLAEAHVLFNVAVLTAVASLLVGGNGFLREYRRLSRSLGMTLRPWSFLAAHLAAFALFYWLTSLVWERRIDASAHPERWVYAWVAAGVASMLLVSAAAVPPSYWLRLLRRGAGALAAGVAVGVASWVTGQYTLELWRPLHRSTFWLAHGLLSLVFRQTVCDPETLILGTPTFSVKVHPSCSGYEGIGLIWVFLGAFLCVFRRELRFPRALLLIPVGTVLIWLINTVRIAVLVMIGVWVSPEVAHGGFHSQGGWLGFLAVSLGLFSAARTLPFFQTPRALAPAVDGRPHPTAPYLAPLFMVLVTAMFTGAFSSGFDRFYPIRVVSAAGVFWYFRDRYAALRWSWDWGAVAIGVVVFGVWMVLEPAPTGSIADDSTAAGVMGLSTVSATVWLIFRVVGSVVTVPLAEELAFRGYLMRRLIAADFESVPIGKFTGLSLVVSSVLFGMLHGRWLAGMLAGLGYALAVYRRRSLGDAVVAHATTNALIAACVLITDRWTLWS